MSATLSIVAVLAVGAIRLARALAGSPPPQQTTEADRVLREQHGVPPWPVAELPEYQQGRLVGNVRALDRTLTAPLTGRACVYYVVLVVQPAASGWQERITDRRGVAFALADASGSAVIDPAHASVALAFDHREQLRALDPATAAQQAVLARHADHRRGRSRLRFLEAVLSVGERVTVVGTGTRRPYVEWSAESDYRSAAPTRLQLEGSDAAPLSISSHYLR